MTTALSRWFLLLNLLSTSVRRTVCTFALLLTSLSPNLLIAEQEFRPVTFDSIRGEVLEKIVFPSVEGVDELVIRCAARVTVRGSFEDMVCYENDGFPKESKALGKQIRKLFRRLRVPPALVDGERKEVWMNFSMVLRSNARKGSALLIENHLFNSDLYGTGYIASQRYDRFPWSCGLTSRGYSEIVKVRVSASGEAVSIDSSSNVPSCAASIRRAVESSKFIPAQHNGRSVDSTHIELFLN